MRMLLHAEFPVEPFNTYVRDGSIGQKMQTMMESLKPEAAYFSEHHGKRGGVFVINVNEPSQIPAMAEPLFLLFSAEVEFRIAMTPDDLMKANLESIGKKLG